MRKFIVRKMVVRKNYQSLPKCFINCLNKFSKDFESRVYGGKLLIILTSRYAQHHSAKRVSLICCSILLNVANAKNNFVKSVWCPNIKDHVIQTSKELLDNGKDAQDVRCLSKNLRAAIIWHANVNINSALSVSQTGSHHIIIVLKEWIGDFALMILKLWIQLQLVSFT